MIGVRKVAQGMGLGGAVLQAVHEISKRDEASTGVGLVTSRRSNVSLYRHFGYDAVGRADVGGALSVWGFFRPDGSS